VSAGTRPAGRVLLVTGTGTDVGKTIVTAAIAALAGGRVAAVKLAQTGVADGEPGDLAAVRRLAAPRTAEEFGRFPDPLSPEAAARLSGRPAVDLPAAADRLAALAREHDLVLAEGAGGLLVRFDAAGATVADLAGRLGAPLVVVVRAGLGTLNETALTLEALARRGLSPAGVVIGSWPAGPGLAERTNLTDLETLAGAPLAGALPEGAGGVSRTAFRQVALAGLAPAFGGRFDPAALRAATGD
jgi:dethiobiotin synthase